MLAAKRPEETASLASDLLETSALRNMRFTTSMTSERDMVRTMKLKVFRTPIGFHDAYVAAPSQKAALAAWGADSNLFASGSAELVEDPALTSEPLANPGKVIKRLRGSLDDHLAALPKQSARTRTAPEAQAPPTRTRKLAPRPRRDALDRAEAQLEALEVEQAQVIGDIDRRQAALDRERKSIQDKHSVARRAAHKRAATARDRYEAAMARWRQD